MTRESSTLITTKLHRPLVTGDHVDRPRLLQQLQRGLSQPLTLVCAGAGFGKTTLVSCWLAQNDERATMNDEASTAQNSGLHRSSFIGHRFPSAWLSLDAQDSDLMGFVTYLVAALRTMFPDACAVTLDLIHAQMEPPPELLAATLLNEIALLPERFVLVLDDFGAIQGEAVPELLNRLLHHWPPPLHLVLISRHNPPLPLARWRAHGQISEIRSRDLRFTAEETAAYLDLALPAPLNQPARAALEQRTEGWIAGLQLATLALRGLSDAEIDEAISSVGDADAVQYLVDEVLSGQPQAIQDFLLKTSILDRFCASLCEAAARGEDAGWPAQESLAWIERANLFVVPWIASSSGIAIIIYSRRSCAAGCWSGWARTKCSACTAAPQPGLPGKVMSTRRCTMRWQPAISTRLLSCWSASCVTRSTTTSGRPWRASCACCPMSWSSAGPGC